MDSQAQSFTEVLHHAPSGGVFHLPEIGRNEVQTATRDAEMVFHLVNLEDSEDTEAALELLAEGMRFPEWFGNNFDALYDCLTDLTWQETSSTVIVLTGCDGLYASAPEAWETLINVFKSASEYWRDEDVPFWVFIDMRADELNYLSAVN